MVKIWAQKIQIIIVEVSKAIRLLGSAAVFLAFYLNHRNWDRKLEGIAFSSEIILKDFVRFNGTVGAAAVS
jgi:hypothetical protein